MSDELAVVDGIKVGTETGSVSGTHPGGARLSRPLAHVLVQLEGGATVRLKPPSARMLAAALREAAALCEEHLRP